MAFMRYTPIVPLPVVLISLKEAGHRLNQTTADEGFILDPWWSPAVESQAIDQADRILEMWGKGSRFGHFEM